MKQRSRIGRRSFLKYTGGRVLVIAGGLQGSRAWSATAAATDYAVSRYVDLWLRHPVYGDPSFDAFNHLPGNPILTGAPPYGWPVNGFLFSDPISGNWYIYVGDYAKGYIGPEPNRCVLLRSKNRGQSWENLGVVLHGDARMFDKGGNTPDVSVVFEDDRYHMVYDWTLPDRKDGGLAYASADRPEGPWHREAEPITRNSTLKRLLGKYQRTYAGTLVRRKNDWLILAMMDNPPYSWAIFAISAQKPQGPYSKRTLIRHVEVGYYYPPLMEYFPAFVDAGWVYAPATSVARNRNFQVILRAPLEKATNPGAWEMASHGSVWHSEDAPNEAHGIWGQTFSGWVNQERTLRAMFPSRNTKGYGTINLAERPWSKPLRERGFHFSGDNAPSLTCLRRSYSDFTLEAELRVRGKTRIIWSYQAPLGPNQPTSNSTLHPLSLTRYQGLELTPNEWRVVEVDKQGKVQVVAKGASHSNSQWKVTIGRRANGATSLASGGKEVWKGALSPGGGTIGLLAESHAHVSVGRFIITGKSEPGTLSFLYTEAWLDAGENPANWVEQKDAAFRFGTGAVHREGGGHAKWNFVGSGFKLWSPKGPDYGMVDIRLDGSVVATVNLRSAQPQPSHPVYSKAGLSGPFHAIILEARNGRLVIDSLDVSE